MDISLRSRQYEVSRVESLRNIANSNKFGPVGKARSRMQTRNMSSHHARESYCAGVTFIQFVKTDMSKKRNDY